MTRPGLFTDIRTFILRRPPIPTFIRYNSEADRKDFDSRILQRVDVRVEHYAILNIHRITVKAPVAFVFEKFRTWGPDSVWWPNRIAQVERVDEALQHIRVFFLGRRKHPFGIKTPFFGLNVIPLFDMRAMRIVELPDSLDPDNARYMLYQCDGGYPVGIVAIYVRSGISERQEPDETHLFFAVGFNFYGKADWPRRHIINTLWEWVHNRVTANSLNLFKAECEASFEELLAEVESSREAV